ncbi:hypothetical protein BKA69DRAFT_1093884 [Paraphysoderma sedebokerense]|nr:hypothetical protein BKA69DRAFT_1093884 [Paraphysoderma sedebokerense]
MLRCIGMSPLHSLFIISAIICGNLPCFQFFGIIFVDSRNQLVLQCGNNFFILNSQNDGEHEQTQKSRCNEERMTGKAKCNIKQKNNRRLVRTLSKSA